MNDIEKVKETLPMKLIDKNALVAEVERLKKNEGWCQVGKDTADVYYARGFRFACERIISFLDTLEVNELEKKGEVSEELEEAANKYITGKYSPWLYKSMFDCFAAGANWQKRQMMKGSFKGSVAKRGSAPYHLCVSAEIPKRCEVAFGDKVKVIIIKED